MTLLLIEQPAFNTHPKDPQTSRKGESITFSIDANGIPEPTFSWFKGESAVTANNRISLTEGNKKLSIANVNRSDSGEYRCVATNSVRTVYSNAATLIVHCKKTFSHFFTFLPLLLSWIISVSSYEHCLWKKGLVRCPSNLITFHYSFLQNQKSCKVLEKIILYLCFFANQESPSISFFILICL